MKRRAFLVATVLFLSSCEGTKVPATAKLESSAPLSSAGAAAVRTRLWDDELGALLATQSLDGGAAVVFVRDTGTTADFDVELLSHDDHISKAVLHTGPAIRACAWRRHASVTEADGRAAPNGWALALAPGIATPVGIDGVGDLLPRDSANLVARISRLVSAIPEDSLSAPFRGLPIVVRDAWRFQLADSTIVSIAIATRSLNVESNPRAEAITLIAEPDSSAGAGQWRTAYSERTAGPEDRVEGIDLLAAFTVHGGRVAVALLREGDGGPQVEIVERTSPGVWTARWSSVALPCPNF
jgi:hypothetical protein